MSTRGPELVAFIFKIFAALTILGGAGTAVSVASSTVTDRGGVVAGVVAATILTTAALLFFAYVLELMIDIRDNVDIVADVSVADDEVAP